MQGKFLVLSYKIAHLELSKKISVEIAVNLGKTILQKFPYYHILLRIYLNR